MENEVTALQAARTEELAVKAKVTTAKDNLSKAIETTLNEVRKAQAVLAEGEEPPVQETPKKVVVRKLAKETEQEVVTEPPVFKQEVVPTPKKGGIMNTINGWRTEDL